MKGCAKFLNFIALLVFLLIFIAFLGTCAATAVVAIKPDIIPEDLLDALKAVTINGKPVTMEILQNHEGDGEGEDWKRGMDADASRGRGACT